MRRIQRADALSRLRVDPQPTPVPEFALEPTGVRKKPHLTPAPNSSSQRPRRPSRPPPAQRAFDVAVDDAGDAYKEKDWSSRPLPVFLGLYARMHEHVYGVMPAELVDEWHPALKRLQSFVMKELDGDYEQLVDFMRWSWKRIKRRRERASEDDDFRMGWRYQFSKKLLVDYRAAMNR